MLASVTHILPLARIRRVRTLPTKGTVLVRGGQDIKATDVVAEANINAEYATLDISRALGVKPAEADRYLLREIGEDIESGALIAKKGGLSSRQLRAPVSGRLVAVSGGQALLEVLRPPFQLLAGIPGNVVEVIADEGAIIETTGAWIQGVWGNGEIGDGLLRSYGDSPEAVVEPGAFSAEHKGNIAVVPSCSDRKLLEAAAKSGIGGMIIGSLATRLRPFAERMPYPIVVLDGFGGNSMNGSAFNLLSTSNERQTVINAEPYDRFKGTRPEVIIPVANASASAAPQDIAVFDLGQTVRVLKAPFAGRTAKIAQIFEQGVRFPSGLRAQGAEVEFADGERALVPLANIEVIG